MFKVGDMVVNVNSGYILGDGCKVTTGVVTSIDSDGDVMVFFDGLKRSFFCYENEVTAAPIGKTLTELDVKPGDVVRGVDCKYADYKDFTCVEIVAEGMFDGEHTLTSESYGRGIFGDTDGKWVIVSRAPTAPAPIATQRMHPDYFFAAIKEFAKDNGFKLNMVTARTSDGHHISMAK